MLTCHLPGRQMAGSTTRVSILQNSCHPTCQILTLHGQPLPSRQKPCTAGNGQDWECMTSALEAVKVAFTGWCTICALQCLLCAAKALPLVIAHR